ncbi:unnamed protein product [Tilletia controversa]|nr:unnamed protein product [Tilletia controversa]CAD6945244.1 unnamed protein product [Tilletia controversa]
MERVQYSLERTLPSLHTLDSTKTFSRDELRALTAQRASLESALVRRVANRDGSDYIAYVAFEDKIEKLRLVRTAKAEAQTQADRKGKGRAKAAQQQQQQDDEAVPVGGTKEQQARLRASYLARCISIFERGVTKLKDSLALWQAYLAWARARNMRIVVGRVFARVLNLHTAHIPLWIQAAGYELGTNFAANTARLLLQRAISLNTLPFTEVALPATALPNQAEEADEAETTRPKKKRRQSKQTASAIATSINSLLDDKHRPIAFTLNLTPAERNMLRLWVEYARMELVFLERLRRRWSILGLGQASNATALTSRPAEGSSSQAKGISQRFVDAAAQSTGEETIDTSILANLPGDGPVGIDEEAKEDVEQRDEADALENTDVPTSELALPSPPPTGESSLQTPARAAQHAIMSGGLLAPLISTAFTSVAPKLRLPLALGLIKLLRSFPFLDAEPSSSSSSSEIESGLQFNIRAELGGRVLDAFTRSTTVVQTSHPDSASNGATRAILLAARPIFLDAPAASSRWSSATREKEGKSHGKLRAQGRLCPVADDEVDGLLNIAKEDLKVRQQSQAGRSAAELLVSMPGPRSGSVGDDDAPTHLVSLQIIDALTPLASAATRTLLPILLGQFVGNLFTCAQKSSAGADAGVTPGRKAGSSISAAAYGLSLSPAGEEARFGALAAQTLKTVLEARLPVKKVRKVEEIRGDDEEEQEQEQDDDEAEVEAEAEKQRGEVAGQLLVQEANLRTLLETAIKRFLQVK